MNEPSQDDVILGLELLEKKRKQAKASADRKAAVKRAAAKRARDRAKLYEAAHAEDAARIEGFRGCSLKDFSFIYSSEDEFLIDTLIMEFGNGQVLEISLDKSGCYSDYDSYCDSSIMVRNPNR
jgi:hypothetical protein